MANELTEHHRAEIKARGLDPELALRYGVKTMGQHIAFEYRLNGQVHNTKIRKAKGEMPWQLSGQPLVLWNVDSMKEEEGLADRQLIIVEGEYDGVACIQAGFRDVVSVPNGAPASDKEDGKKRYEYLYQNKDLCPELAQFQTIILAVDGDEKGTYLRDALAVRLGEHRCFYVEWPKGCKDANDVIRSMGPSALAHCLWNPKRLFTDEVATYDDIPDPEAEVSFDLGFPGLDLRIPKKGFGTVLGPYESGKSTFLRQLMVHMSLRHGLRSAITCFEESAKWRTSNALCKTFLGKPLAAASSQELTDATNWVRNNVVFIQKQKRVLMTGQRLLDRIEYAVKAYGVDLVIIDPFNEIDHSFDRSQSKTEYIANFIMEMKDLADSYGIFIFCCVHPPAETMRRKAMSGSKFYTLADAADSSHFANKSDIGLCFWRPGVDNVTLLNVDKVKNAELCGKPTGVILQFDPSADRYTVDRTGWDVLASYQQAA